MPAARESLLDAARTALARRPWSAVRMVEVAASAGVSRQTLYNEFGGKEGLARALVRREAEGYLAGIDRALAAHTDAGDRLTAAAEWTASAARDNALLRALLTGCWNEWLPGPPPVPTPGEFVRLVRDRAVTALLPPAAPPEDVVALTRACELAVRVGLSCVCAPPGGGGTGDLVRRTLRGWTDRGPVVPVPGAARTGPGGTSGTTPRAGGRSPRG
ncbi:TetR/AcrR family transcriptional regulator [Streptomyces sp. J2-1]|uniref:TetR/AcrR family transcriptional regulator n=1 Tax=Streptomyces corallincola TaxID=2851888 RepID=UPI001C38E8D6|nr:TetR/AcrR family transcriptional regulator [Streptomyces corallincola]MBV2353173.1 TetR/AcrR family transcriptional regulator [Streptomyces corallincola]